MNFLKRARLKAGLKLRPVAREAGIDHSYYRYIENGRYNPSQRVCIQIADAMNKLTGTNDFDAREIAFMNIKAKPKKAAA